MDYIKVHMPFYPLEKKENLHNGYKRQFKVADQSLLLIMTRNTPYLIENKCGHFGAPLDTGVLENDAIVCDQHGISFNLKTGEIANRPYENADPVKTFEFEYREGYLGVVLED